MFLTHFNQIIDYDLDLFVRISDMLDAEVERNYQEASTCPDPDAFGIFDRMEHITGLGFVACQTYLASTYGFLNIEKDFALTLAPYTAQNIPVVTIVNHAANLWKHQDKWALRKSTRDRDRILHAFAALGYTELGDYPLSNCLAKICAPSDPKFRNLVPFLRQWRDTLRMTKPRRPSSH